MALRISTHKEHRITSQMLNDRVTDVVGGNALLSGFEVIKVSNTQLKVGPGKCIINGAIIEETSNTTQNYSSSWEGYDSIIIAMRYNHLNASAEILDIAKEHMMETDLAIAKIEYSNGVITNIIQEPYTMTLSELTEVTEKIDDMWDKSPNSNLEGKEIKVENSARGQVENLVIKGQTYHNLVDEYNIERPVCGELTVEENHFHKLNTEAGAVNAAIKGRTIHNLAPDVFKNEVKLIKNDSLVDRRVIFNKTLFKPNTTYRYKYHITDMNLGEGVKYSCFIRIDYNGAGPEYIQPPNKLVAGVKSGQFTTQNLPIQSVVFEVHSYVISNGYVTVKNFLVCEDSCMDLNIDDTEYITGIKSVGEDDGNIVAVKSCGKNIVDAYNDIGKFVISDNGNPISNVAWRMTNNMFNIKPNTTYVIGESSQNYKQYKVCIYDKNKEFVQFVNFNGSSSTVFTTPSNAAYFRFSYSVSVNHQPVSREGLQIEEGTTITPYEPYQESIVSHKLSEPLRRLPNGVCDEIVDGKVIRRVGKRIFNGSENWILANEGNSPFIYIVIPDIKHQLSSLLCDTIPVRQDKADDMIGANYQLVAGIMSTETSQEIRLRPGDLSTTLQASKAWLSKNPTTMYYELLEPIITPIDSDLILPAGTHDEIKDNKAIRNIGKFVFDGSEDEEFDLDFYIVEKNNQITFNIFVPCNVYSDGQLNLICDRFKTTRDVIEREVEGVSLYTYSRGDKVIRVSIFKSKLETPDIAGFKKWLAKNPITVWCKLITPHTERMPVQAPISTFSGVTYIVSQNTVVPKIKIDSVGTKYNVPLLRPGTKYTIKASIDIKANLAGAEADIVDGLAKITTPKTLSNNNLILSGWGGNARDVMVFEGEADCHRYIEGIQSVGDINGPILPNGICDEYIGSDKMIQKVKKIIINGSEGWTLPSKQGNKCIFGYFQNNNVKHYSSNSIPSIMCSHLPSQSPVVDSNCARIDNEFIATYADPDNLHPGKNWIYVSIRRDRLETQDLEGFKKWLSKNPITAWYELDKHLKKTCSDWNIRLLSDNGNILRLNNYTAGGYIKWEDGVIKSNPDWIVSDYIAVKPNTIYTFRNTNYNVCFYDAKKQLIKINRIFDSILNKNNSSDGYFIIKTPSNACYIRQSVNLKSFDIASITEGYDTKSTKKSQLSATNINLQEPLRSLPNGVCDEIAGNQVIRRVGKVVLSGSENWVFNNDFNNGRYQYVCPIISDLAKPNNRVNIFNDRFPVTFLTNCDAMWLYSFAASGSSTFKTNIVVHCKLKNATQLKQWLQNNPITMYYELAEPIIVPIGDDIVLTKKIHNTISDDKVTKNIGTITVDGTQNIYIDTSSLPNQDNTITFCIDNPNGNNLSNGGIWTDILNGIDRDTYLNNDVEGLMTADNNKFKGRIIKHRLAKADAIGIRNWFKQNPITVFYQLKTSHEESAPKAPLALQSWDGLTHILSINAVSPTLALTIPTNLSKVINQNSKRLSALEDLIDGMIIPGVIDADYRNVLFEFNYGMDKMNLR